MPSFDRGIKMDEALRQLSRDIGADYVGIGGYKFLLDILYNSCGNVDAHVGPWTIRIGSFGWGSRARTEM